MFRARQTLSWTARRDEKRSKLTRVEKAASADCLARWEDEGGAVHSEQPNRRKPGASRAHIAALEHKRRQLKGRIKTEQKRPAPCNLHLRDLKRQNLILKEKILNLRRV